MPDIIAIGRKHRPAALLSLQADVDTLAPWSWTFQ